MKLMDVKIGIQLRVGMAIILLLVGLLAIQAWVQTDNLWLQTKQFYEHPFTVRGAVAIIHTQILAIHRDMKDLCLTKSGQERNALAQTIDAREADVYQQFKIVYDRYLGQRSDIEEAERSFAQWKTIRSKTRRLLETGKITEAIERTRPTGAGGIHVERMIAEINHVSEFASNRAIQFYRNAEESKNSLNRQLAILVAVLFTLSMVVTMLLLKGIRTPLEELTAMTEQFRQGNEKARSRYISANEFGKLSSSFNAMADSIEAANQYQRLEHERLSAMVEERTRGLEQELAERRKAESALTDSERLLKESQQIAGLGSYVLDMTTGRWTSSPVLDTIFGIDENFDRSIAAWESMLHPNWRATMSRYFAEEVVGKGTRFDKDYQIVRVNDGITCWVHGLGELEFSNAGVPLKMIGTIMDITTRKNAEEALTSSMSLLNAALESTADGILVVDQHGRSSRWNRTFVDMWHIPEEILSTRNDEPMLQYVLDQIAQPEVFLAKVSELYGRPEESSFDQIGLADGRVFERYSQPQRIGSTVVGRVWSFRDVTQRKSAESKLHDMLMELERSNKELEQFASIASHDLQEPLRMVSSYTQLLAERYQQQLDEKAKKYIGYAVDGAVRMQRLINDLLTYSRVGTRGKSPESTDPHSALGEAIGNLSVAINESGAIITNDELPMVRADASQLIQLFQNLISNAIKFHGKDSPRIHISAQDRGREWVFSVKDNGIGIHQQYEERIFIIFQRLHTRQEYSGTGIGLAVCRRIVERHEGKIWFESEPGNGATFFFTIPK